MSLVNKQPNYLAVRVLCLQSRDPVLELGFGLLGIDQSLEMVVQDSRRNRLKIERQKAQLRLGNFSSLPWPAGSIDKILAVNVAYFFRPDAREVSETWRILKPGGRFTPPTGRQMSQWKFSDPETHTLLGEDDLRGLLTRGEFSDRRRRDQNFGPCVWNYTNSRKSRRLCP